MENCVYRDPRAPVEARVKDLLSRMTLQEKLGQMTQIERSVATPSALTDLSIGSVLSLGGSWPFENAVSEDWAEMIDGMQRRALESRLGIPLLYGVDAVHGNNNVYGATIFPHNIGLGATRDQELVRNIGVATALEVRASGSQYTFAPSVAVCKDPRWGRCYESFSEDTDVVRRMSSIVTGLQGQPPSGHPFGYPFLAGRDNVIACAKHFVGDGGTHEGINEGNTISSYEELESIHLAPYLDCLSQGVCTIMASYTSWNGTQMHRNKFLLTDVLKGKLGFKGFIITDCAALDRLSNPFGSNYRQCVLAAISAGIDMLHRELAREAVRKSVVLLKNGKDTLKPFLPLDKNAKCILVAGQHADDLGFQCGGWTKTWDGRSGRITIGTTILDAIKAAVGEETELVYEQNPSPATFSNRSFSFSIVIVGEPPYCESGGDSKDLIIPSNGSELISFVAERVPTLAILISGRPMYVETRVWERVEGFIAAWLPGSEGAGVTDVIFGDHEFKGRLPMSWFRSVDQLPMNPTNTSYDPLFPIGFGLTTKNHLVL
ncbi:unnamed protein product [Cuscuta europaea]|uniref:Beta-glucosidase n=1 Tax=Cuscuta europaea TaxID=41803 RepID=A0A9P1E146_CUSEU|nr:unnamed protein product [Cuscuta europaea]